MFSAVSGTVPMNCRSMNTCAPGTSDSMRSVPSSGAASFGAGSTGDGPGVFAGAGGARRAVRDPEAGAGAGAGVASDEVEVLRDGCGDDAGARAGSTGVRPDRTRVRSVTTARPAHTAPTVTI